MEEEYSHTEHVFMREDEARDIAEYEAKRRRTRTVALPIWDNNGWCVMVYSKKQKPECVILLSENHD